MRRIAPWLLLGVLASAAHAGEPEIDLAANRYLFHLYRDGLVVPVASEGLRKYTKEYSSPWGEVFAVAGKRGRVLQKRAATLRVPWRRPARPCSSCACTR